MPYLHKKTRILVLALFFLTFISYIAQIIAFAESSNNVIDYLNYLTDSEVLTLQTEIDSIKKNYRLDVVIVITDDTQGKSSRDFADDFFDYNGYGIGSDYSGLLMLVNMQDREMLISTSGRAIDIFTDSRITRMEDNVISSLSNADYYNACKTFIRDVKNYANAGVPSGQYRVETEITYANKVSRRMKSLPIYITALVISLGATLILSLSSKGKVTINSGTYEETGSFVLSETRDDYIRESTTRTRINDSSSSGGSGKSSTHIGSSGRTHGGSSSGRKF
ncbi:TPM domain-containing protein [Acetivibrio straminisolvens]|nr:TPM domain-containing protein [Acetivibrio straminisolvens]